MSILPACRIVWCCCCLLAATCLSSARANDKALKGQTVTINDLKVTVLNLPGKATLPCMLWADAKGSAFLALEGEAGVLKRISFPECNVIKQKSFNCKFAWMSLSEYGVLLSETDAEEVWIVDPKTLEVTGKIVVPKLKRAASAPGLNWAVACDRGRQDQRLYVVDLVLKKIEVWTPPQNMVRAIGLDNPAVAPNGAYVFTQGDLVTSHMFRFSVKGRKLTFEEAEDRPGADGRFQIGEFNPNNSAGITISPDSRFVCQVYPGNAKTPIYPADSFAKHECIIEHGLARFYPGYGALEKPMALGFDLVAGYIYSQNGGQEFTIYTLTGVEKKAYLAGFGSVRQFLVHPTGHRVILLREAVAAPGRAESVLIEVPEKK